MAQPATGKSTEQTDKSELPTKLYIENTLLRVTGALFCHDQKRAAQHTQEIVLNRGASETVIMIRPDPRLGQPGPLAHKVFVALIKKHSDYGRPIQSDISFTRREIGRLIGRQHWGGKDSEKLSRALHEIHHTFVTAHFKDTESGRAIEHSFNVFPEIRIERREFASDPIEACTVTLAQPIVASLRDEHFTCLNHSTLQQLGTIGQALYMRLFFHFANRYDGRDRRFSFLKRYDDICLEWLGGLTVLQHQSKIVGEQLGSHLEQLIALGFLSGYSIAPAKAREGFVFTFRPGSLFFADYDRFYRATSPRRPQLATTDEQRNTADPLRLAYLFIEKRTGQPVRSIAFVPSKDVQTAKELLAELPYDEMPAFINYALAEAARTNFSVQTLGGIKQYLAGYIALRERRKSASRHQASRRQQETAETEQRAYDVHRLHEAQRIFDLLPVAEQAEIRKIATGKASLFSGDLAKRMADHHVARITAERYKDRLPSFEDWRESRAAA